MNVPIFIAIIVAFLLTVLIYRIFFTRDAIIKRKIRKAERVSIESFPEGGVAKISGFLVYEGEPLTSPLTGRRCAQYSVDVEQYRSHGKGGSWHTIIQEEDAQDFLLDDGTGVARVKMAGAQVAVTRDERFRTGAFQDPTPELEAFLARHGRESKGFFGLNKKLRFKEGVLEGGEEVAVCGVGHGEKDPETRKMRLVLEGRGEIPLYVSDDVKVLG